MAGDTTALENRVKALEVLVNNLLHSLASTDITAGQALQNSMLNQAGGGGGSGGAPVLIYTTSVGTARVGNRFGQGMFQIITGQGNPQVGTSTGNNLDQSLVGWNVTGGTTPIGAYGIALNINGEWYYVVIDCLSTTNPQAPANVMTVQAGIGTTNALAAGSYVLAYN